MNDSTIIVKEQIASTNLRHMSKPIRWIREILAILLWLIVIIHVFVCDIIGPISTVIPISLWLVKYRSLIILGFLIVAWLMLGNTRSLRFFGYIILYPLVVALWHIPRSFFRYWPILVAFSPAILSFLRTFRFTLTAYGISLIAAVTILVSEEMWLIIAGMIVLGSLLVIHYYRRMKTAFAAKSVLAVTADVVGTMWEKLKSSKEFTPPEDIDTTTKEGKKNFGASLIIVYLITAGLSRIASTMRSVAESKRLDLFLIVSLCGTISLTIIVFSLLFLGLEKSAPGSFLNASGYLSFIEYSLCVLTTSDLSPLQPVLGIARILSFLELVGSLSLLVLMVFIILTSLRERYRDDFIRLSTELKTTARHFETILISNYELTIHAAEEWLLSYSRVIARFILRLRHEKETIAELEMEMKRRLEKEDAQ